MTAYDFAWVGGDTSLDLVNTLVHHFDQDGPYEMLAADSIVAWYEGAELIESSDKAALWPRRISLLRSAKDLRSNLNDLYRSIMSKQPARVTDAAMVRLNSCLGRGHDRITVRRDKYGFCREVNLEIVGDFDPIVRVAHAAAKRLDGIDTERLRECSNPDCDLIFYDETRNGRRRWCDMATCGNRAKQARFRAASH